MPEKNSQYVCVKDDFVRIGEFIGSAVDIAAEVQKEQHLIACAMPLAYQF